MEASPISVSDIVNYLDLKGYYDHSVRNLFFDLVTALDDEWRTQTKPADPKVPKTKKRK